MLLLFQVAIHAIGDRANDFILDLYKSVASKNRMRDRRFRVSSTVDFKIFEQLIFIFLSAWVVLML